MKARTARQTLNESNQKLVQLMRDYKAEFDAFKTNFLKEHTN